MRKSVQTLNSVVTAYFDGNKETELLINTRCAGIMLQDIGNDVESVSVSLVSENLRDQVFYDLNSDILDQISSKIYGLGNRNMVLSLLQQADGSQMENPNLKRDYFIPFGLGNLLLSEKSKLKVVIKLKDESEFNSAKVSRVILAHDALVPLTVKNVNNSSFDSAYYRNALLTEPVTVQYFNNVNEKVYLPEIFTKYTSDRSDSFIKLLPNKTYEMSKDSNVYLLDY